jgi:putative hydrolase of the HAD superfamily
MDWRKGVETMVTQHLLFDLDDTLIYCNSHFTRVKSQFVARMISLFQAHGIREDEILHIQLHADLDEIQKFGLGKERFPNSLMTTYRKLCERVNMPVDRKLLREIEALGYSVYDMPVVLYPHAWETLTVLRDQGHELYVYTGGDYEVQKRKLEESGLVEFFSPGRQFISTFKNGHVLESILTELRLPRMRTWMIGNSARSDIVPALAAGIHAIHIPDDSGWEYDYAEIRPNGASVFVELSSLAEVPPVIGSYASEYSVG